MKKKIGDLTLNEIDKMCRTTLCENCPLAVELGKDWYECKIDYIQQPKELLEKEIEVEE